MFFLLFLWRKLRYSVTKYEKFDTHELDVNSKNLNHDNMCYIFFSVFMFLMSVFASFFVK